MKYSSAAALQIPVAKITASPPIIVVAIICYKMAFIIMTVIMPLYAANGQRSVTTMPALICFCTAKRGCPVTVSTVDCELSELNIWM
jgi:hypothetical protein